MTLASLFLNVFLTVFAGDPPEAGAKGGSGLALLAAKVLACPYDGPQVIDRAVVLIRDGKIQEIGRAHV